MINDWTYYAITEIDLVIYQYVLKTNKFLHPMILFWEIYLKEIIRNKCETKVYIKRSYCSKNVYFVLIVVKMCLW